MFEDPRCQGVDKQYFKAKKKLSFDIRSLPQAEAFGRCDRPVCAMGCGSSKATSAALQKVPVQVKKIPARKDGAKHVAVILPGSYRHMVTETHHCNEVFL